MLVTMSQETNRKLREVAEYVVEHAERSGRAGWVLCIPRCPAPDRYRVDPRPAPITGTVPDPRRHPGTAAMRVEQATRSNEAV